MQNAFIIHGMPERDEYFSQTGGDSPSNSHWLPWIQQKLIARDILAETPEMPRPYDPLYEEWKSSFERYAINPDTILIGHSLGGGFLVRWLSETKTNVGVVVLVAPWLDPDRDVSPLFFDFTIDPALLSHAKKMTIFVSKDDDTEILRSVEIIKNVIPDIEVVEFSDKGHFDTESMGTREFPELLEYILK